MILLTPYPFRVEEKQGQFSLPQSLPALDEYLQGKLPAWLHIRTQADLHIAGCAMDEAYRLSVAQDGVRIDAATEAGALYGYISLMQLAHAYRDAIPCMNIEDAPRYAYRGFLMDVGRYFYPLEDLYKIADMCALHKINYLHWHLTEDQGWRIEIRRYPLLATKGSMRSHTNFNCKPHGGFYSQRDVRAFVEYCRARHITVIPEIDMPGHMQAAMACYPYLGCFDRELPVATHWGVKHDILCAGKETTYRFVYDVLDEVCELFDSPYIHLGGDEAPKFRWKLCPHCQAKMRELGLQDENELQSYFMNRIAKYLQTKGRTAIMWNEEVPTGRCDRALNWQVWHVGDEANRRKIVDELQKSGRKIVYSVCAHTYLDLPYRQVPVRACYDTDPAADLQVDAANVLGIEAALWTEYVPDMKKAMRMSMPRLGALSESMWSPPAGKVFANYTDRIPAFNAFLQSQGLQPAPMRRAFPSAPVAIAEDLWFRRRPLHWHGLHNLVDDIRVKRLAKRMAMRPANLKSDK